MYFGPRRPSLTKKLAARTSVKRVLRHNLGLKAPRGYGWLTNPKRAAYNRVYYRKNKAWGQGAPVLLVLVLAAVAWVVKALIATWYIWVPLVLFGAAFYVLQYRRASAAAEVANAVRQAEEAQLTAMARAAERRGLEARFPPVHAGLVPVRALSDPSVVFAEVIMESGESRWLGRSADGTFIEVVSRKRKAGDADGRYSGAYGAWVFDLSREKWMSSSAPPGARALRTLIEDLQRLAGMIAGGEGADAGYADLSLQ